MPSHVGTDTSERGEPTWTLLNVAVEFDDFRVHEIGTDGTMFAATWTPGYSPHDLRGICWELQPRDATMGTQRPPRWSGTAVADVETIPYTTHDPTTATCLDLGVSGPGPDYVWIWHRELAPGDYRVCERHHCAEYTLMFS